MSVHKEFDSNGDVTSTASGRFDADVNLTAYFGRGGGQASLEGMVSNFSGNAIDDRWSVTLERTDSGLQQVVSTPMEWPQAIWVKVDRGQQPPSELKTCARMASSAASLLASPTVR